MGNKSSKRNFTVYVKTGDRLGMGTDDTISVVLQDENGLRSGKCQLDNLLSNDFESGRLDSFQIAIEDGNFGDPVYMELRRDKCGLLDDEWYCEFVRVLSEKTNHVHMFPIHRWVRAGCPIKVKEDDAVLPQDDENVIQRQEELQRKRDMYVPAFNEATGTILMASLPKDENFSFSDKFDLMALLMRLKLEHKLIGFTSERWESLEDLENVYKPPHFPKPSRWYVGGIHLSHTSWGAATGGTCDDADTDRDGTWEGFISATHPWGAATGGTCDGFIIH